MPERPESEKRVKKPYPKKGLPEIKKRPLPGLSRRGPTGATPPHLEGETDGSSEQK